MECLYSGRMSNLFKNCKNYNYEERVIKINTVLQWEILTVYEFSLNAFLYLW